VGYLGGVSELSRARSLFDVDPAELPAPPDAPYRAKQLATWLYQRGARDFDAMTSLPRAWRSALAGQFSIDPFAAVRRFPSRDGSVRYLFDLPDGKQTEAVYMPYDGRKTVCVSSMVGCPAGCAFCATGALGFGRNLSRGEITAQLLAVAWHEGFAPRELRNVVLMGMGEALLNYEAAVGAIRNWTRTEGLAMSPRRITLSTVGLPSRIRRLADEQLPLVLALSLHAPDEETRRAIIPTAHAHPIPEIIDSLAYWQQQGGRRVTIEYTMLAGVNDALSQAQALVRLLKGLKVHVNLIPFNPWPNSGFRSSSKVQLHAFERVVVAAGISTSIRFSRGRDTGGACGQLALRDATQKTPGTDLVEPSSGSAEA